MKEVKIDQIINYLNDLNIIDIRDNFRFNIKHIPNAKNIPMNFLIMNPKNYLDINETYYIYCEMGVNSQEVCERLTDLGYDVVNIVGGFNEYKLLEHLTK